MCLILTAQLRLCDSGQSCVASGLWARSVQCDSRGGVFPEVLRVQGCMRSLSTLLEVGLLRSLHPEGSLLGMALRGHSFGMVGLEASVTK